MSENLNEKVVESEFIASFATRLVDTAHRRPWWFLGIYALAVVFALRYTVEHLGINSYIEDMISEDLPWRQTFIEYHDSFPQFVDSLLIVIDAETPDLAQRAQSMLADALERDQSGNYFRVFLPGAGPFYDRQGLLFLSIDELTALSDRLAELQPMMAILARKPDLNGLANLFERASDGGANVRLAGFDQSLDEFAQSFEQSGKDRYAPTSWGGLLSAEPRTWSDTRRVILVETRRDYARFLPGEAAIDGVRAMIGELQPGPGGDLTVRLTGRVALEHEELKSVEQGSVIVGMLALVLVSIVLWIAFRSFQLIAVSIITLLTGLIGTATFAAFAVGDLNLISISFSVLYIGLGIDFAIHFSMRYRELIREGRDCGEALHRTARDVGGSLVFCALTTSVGFFAFYPTDFIGVSELGLISGVGMYVSLITSLTLLPALLTVWPLSKIRSAPGESRQRPAPAIQAYAIPIRILAAVLALLALATVPDLAFDNNPMNLRDPDSESVTAYDELRSDPRTTPMALGMLLQNRGAAEEQAHQIEQIPEVARTMTIVDMVPDSQAEKLEVIEDLRLLFGSSLVTAPDSEPGMDAMSRLAALERMVDSLRHLEQEPEIAESAQFRKLRLETENFMAGLAQLDERRQRERLELVEDNLLGGLEPALARLRASMRAEEFDLSGLPEEIESQWRSAEGIYRVAIYPRADFANKVSEEQFVRAVQAEFPDATGIAAVEFEAGKLVVSAFRQALTTAIIVVFALLVLLIRNWRDPLLIMVPIVLSALLTVSVIVVSGMSLNFANIIALPLLFGIGVDNGIHIVHRYRLAPTSKPDLMGSSTVRAVFFGTLTTIVSFGSLALSSHRGMATMGRLLTIGMILTLFTTLIILPALLTNRTPKRS